MRAPTPSRARQHASARTAHDASRGGTRNGRKQSTQATCASTKRRRRASDGRHARHAVRVRRSSGHAVEGVDDMHLEADGDRAVCLHAGHALDAHVGGHHAQTHNNKCRWTSTFAASTSTKIANANIKQKGTEARKI